MTAALSAGFGFPSIVQPAHPGAPAGDLAFRLLDVLAITLAVAVTRACRPAGRRVAGLAATGLLPSLALLPGFALADVLVTLIIMLLAAVLLWPVAIASRLGRVGRAGPASSRTG
jgi:hypothetical protein